MTFVLTLIVPFFLLSLALLATDFTCNHSANAKAEHLGALQL
jgi:hypothetical protein